MQNLELPKHLASHQKTHCISVEALQPQLLNYHYHDETELTYWPLKQILELTQSTYPHLSMRVNSDFQQRQLFVQIYNHH